MQVTRRGWTVDLPVRARGLSLRRGPADTVPDVSTAVGIDSGLLVDAVRRLSAARTTGEVQEIVRTAARRIAGADGATVVRLDRGFCHYVDEDAIGPLWKGQRFPADACISGWVMRRQEPAAIEDIYVDARVPHGAYRPTFVRSLIMVPIRRDDPIGAIGNYWAERHVPRAEEIEALQALADATSVALENVQVWSEMEERVADQTVRLREALGLQDRMLGTLAHEVRNCLAGSGMLLDLMLRNEQFDEATRDRFATIRGSIGDASQIVEQQLTAARDHAGELVPRPADVDVAALFAEMAATYDVLRRNDRVELVFEAPDGPFPLVTDEHLLKQALRNLIGNALKFTDHGEVRVAVAEGAGGRAAFSVADTGAGIGAGDLGRIFEEWGQAHAEDLARPRGSGLGLPFVKRIAGLLGGELAVESRPGSGSTFTLTVSRAA